MENSVRRESTKSEPIYRTIAKMNHRFVTKLRSDFIDRVVAGIIHSRYNGRYGIR